MSSGTVAATRREYSNRLIHEKSPYLLQHAHNPVDWYAWGDEAFKKAKDENKPIFLSVGYSTCHWCHVMEHESFENPKIAQVMNKHFVNIKVDREERPDVDKVYMTFVQALSGSGGWPMSVWLTPDLKPFLGATYFPPTDSFGRPGFLSVLTKIADEWAKNPNDIVKSAESHMDALRAEASLIKGASSQPPELSADLFAPVFTYFDKSHDDQLGGFGRAPKFPRPVVFNFLFRIVAREKPTSEVGARALHMCTFTLRQMAKGGMNDLLAGGFHRYSVDRYWHVPHFEKMLYDQSQLAIAYLEAYQITGESDFANVARDILHYVSQYMTHPDGGFYSAEDADSPVDFSPGAKRLEGAFYTWTYEEVLEILGSDTARVFCYFYDVKPRGNVAKTSDPHGELQGKNVLIERSTVALTAEHVGISELEVVEALAEAKKKLLEVRNKRPRPHLDDKILTAWNGLMISAFARMHQAFPQDVFLHKATAAASFIRNNLYNGDKKTLLRSYREGPSAVEGFDADYAFMIQGLLDLYEASGQAQWLEWALTLQHTMDELFWRKDGGGYYSVTGKDSSILVRMVEDYDGAEPSANSVAACNLLRLHAMCPGVAGLHEAAQDTLLAFTDTLKKAGPAVPQLLCALDSYLSPTHTNIVIASQLENPALKPLLAKIGSHYLPHKTLMYADGGPSQAFLQKTAGEHAEFISYMSPGQGGAPLVFVCEGFECRMPSATPEDLKGVLSSVSVSSKAQ